MSLKQRRDHKPRPLVAFGGFNIPADGTMVCLDCEEEVRLVRVIETDTSRPLLEQAQERTYWRHKRRWHKKPT